MNERLQKMVATGSAYPLAEVIVAPKMRKGITPNKLDQFEKTHRVMLGPALREFYGATNGFTFFWKVPEVLPEGIIDRYNAASIAPTTRIHWEMTHGIMIPPLETMLTDKPFGDISLTSRDDETMNLWAGRWMSDGVAVASIRVFDRYLAQGNEDTCIGLLVFPDAEPRIAGITDSGMVDPKRPWMKVETYLDLVITMGGEHGSRYERTGMANVPSSELLFTPEQITQFGRDILRTI